jgi:acyl carrier protein
MEPKIDWLKTWFSQKSDLPENIEEKNYFESGLIDSFTVIELIESLENEFDIRFQESNFQDRRFATIKGLAQIIEEIQLKQGEKK